MSALITKSENTSLAAELAKKISNEKADFI